MNATNQPALEKEAFYTEVTTTLVSISQILEAERIPLDKKFGNYQKHHLLTRGLAEFGGIVVPLEQVEHRILFDGYNLTLFDSFATLFKTIFENQENIFTEFAFRTLIEISFYRVQIMFSELTTNQEKEKFKLLIWLADYSSLAIGRPKNVKTYSKLLSDNRSLLTKKELILFDEMGEAVKNQDSVRHLELLPKIRMMIVSEQNRLVRKTGVLPLFKDKNLRVIYSNLSHIIHGNALLLSNILAKGNTHRLRVIWFLMMSGINVINFVGISLSDEELMERINALNQEYARVAKVVSTYWESL